MNIHNRVYCVSSIFPTDHDQTMKAKFTLILLLYSAVVIAQVKIGAPYKELPDPKHADEKEWDILMPGAYASFGSVDTRYQLGKPPAIFPLKKSWWTKAWRGEKVHTQFVVWATRDIKQLNFISNELKDGKGNVIAGDNIHAQFVRYVMTDGLNNEGGGCGIEHGHDSSLVSDVIDNIKSLDLSKHTTRPVWLSIKVPLYTPAGIYTGNVKVMEGNRKQISVLHYTIEVISHTLPGPDKWKFHLDLWQNPYAIARTHKVKLWSKQHYDIMRPYMKMLANAGQKTITATIIHDPWNNQTYDAYHSMIKWTKKRNGGWVYDYTVFDHWVSYMMSLGINKLINCYSMIPWNSTFQYYDEALDKDTVLIAKPGSVEYLSHWKLMLINFAAHLKRKGWFDKTAIAMDERPLAEMKQTIAVIKSANKNFKISLAGNFHPQIAKDIFDYSMASNQVIDNATIISRNQSGLITTYYTCCTEGRPNTFTFSEPAESVCLAWHAAYKDYNGYLRWAYNCWGKYPLLDSRFGQWASGDTFLVYPGFRSSIRFERLIEGIQDFEKIITLKQRFIKTRQRKKLNQLHQMLEYFDIKNLQTSDAAGALHEAKAKLNNL